MPTAILEAVLGNLAVASALAGVAFIVSRWANRPGVAHFLWLLVLVKLLTPPLVSIPVQCLPARTEPPVATAVPVPSAVLPPRGPVSFVPNESPQSHLVAPAVQPIAIQPAAANANEKTPAPAVPTPLAATTASWVSVEMALLGVCALGTLVSVALTVHRVLRFGRLLKFSSPANAELVEDVGAVANRIGLQRIPRIRVVPGGIAPMVWAIGRPTLYFPAGLLVRLSREQRLALVTHELAHLQRWDHVVRLLEFAALAAYWWCPLVWFARSELRRLEEEACDAAVLAAEPESGYAYASAILETIDYLAGVAPAPTLASGIGDVASLRRRLVLILEPIPTSRTGARMRFAIGTAGFALLAIVPQFDRIRVTAAEVVFASPKLEAIRVPFIPECRDDTDAEPVQFLPTPTRLLPVGQLGESPSLAAALSPDGSRLALAVGSVVTVWDRESQRQLFTLSHHTEAVNAVAFSPDGSRIATVGNDKLAILWNAANGERIHILTGHDRWVLTVAFAPNGRTLATGGYDKTVRLWDLGAGAPTATWTGHAGGVRSVAFAPDGGTIASGGADHEIRLWDVSRGVTTLTLKKHQAAVRVVTFSPDGTRFASGSEDRTVRVWNASDGREIGMPVQLPDYATALTFSRRGQALFAGTFGGHLLNVNPTTGQLRGYIGVEPGRSAGRPAHGEAVTAILTPPDGKSLCTVSQDRTALTWPCACLPQTAELVFRASHPMNALALSPDGRTLATAGLEGVIHIWDASTARELMTLPGHLGGVSSLVFGADGRLVSVGADEQVRIWDSKSGRAISSMIQPTADLSIALSPDARTLAIGGRKLRGVKLLDLATGAKPRLMGEWAGEVSALAFTPTGDQIATGYDNGLVRIWDTTTQQEVTRGMAGTGCVDGISFNLSGNIVAVVVNSGPRDTGKTQLPPTHEVVFLETRDGTVSENQRPLAHPSPISAAAFTTDGLLTAAHDGNLYLWNLSSARVVKIIHGHVDAVRGVALTADGTAVFTAGDRTAKKWPLTNTQRGMP